MKKASLILSSFLILFILSQFALRFSLWGFEGLNSDHAIHILMAETFDWTKDWYYWGQNRLGSLMPLIGSVFVMLGFSAFNAMGISQLILSLSQLALVRTFIKSPWVFAGAAAVLLLPIFPFWMQVFLGHPYLGQLFFNLLILLVYQTNKLDDKAKAMLLPLLAAFSIWTSELSLAFLLAFGIIEFKSLFKILKEQYIYIYMAYCRDFFGYKLFVLG